MPPRFKPRSRTKSARLPATTATRLDAHLEPFLYYLEAECGFSVNTRSAYQADIARFARWWAKQGPRHLAKAELATFTNYLDDLHAAGLQATTIARHLVTIKTFFRYLVLEAVIRESTAELVESPTLWQKLPHVLSPRAVDRLLTAPHRSDRFYLRDRALLAVMYATGCRTSEVVNLALRAVNLNEGFCRVVGKGNKERIVWLNPTARLALETYLDQERPRLAREDCPSVFVSRSGRALTREMVWVVVKRYAARIGASRQVSPHTLRHSFATHMLAGGAEIRALQEMLGHANIRTTQIYTHVDHSRLKTIHARHHPRG